MAFCRNCGSPMGDDERFCPNCGQGVEAPIAVPEKKAPSGPNLFTNLLGFFKSLVSKDPYEGAVKAARSSGLEWVIVAGAFITVFALGSMVTAAEGVGMLARLSGASAYGVNLGRMVRFGAVFGMSVVEAIVLFGIILGVTFLHAKVINRSDISFFGAANLAAYATIPVIAVFILNLLWGLVWMPIAAAFLLTAILVQIKLISAGIKGISEGKETNLFLLMAVYFGAVVLVLLAVYIVYLIDPSMYIQLRLF